MSAVAVERRRELAREAARLPDDIRRDPLVVCHLMVRLLDYAYGRLRRWTWGMSGFVPLGRQGVGRTKDHGGLAKLLAAVQADWDACAATREAVEEREEIGEVGCPVCGREAWRHKPEDGGGAK